MNRTILSLKKFSLFCLIGLQSACQLLSPSTSSIQPAPLLTGTLTSMSQIGVETDRGLLLNLNAVFFDVDKATLRPEGKAKLKEFINVINQNSSRVVYIEGHTDNTGDAQYNQDLSERRAQSVREAFITQGIDSKRLVAKGYGEAKPIAKNSSPTGRQKNRRVEILISKELVSPTRITQNCLYHPPLRWKGCNVPQIENVMILPNE